MYTVATLGVTSYVAVVAIGVAPLTSRSFPGAPQRSQVQKTFFVLCMQNLLPQLLG